MVQPPFELFGRVDGMKLQRCSITENLRDVWRVGFYVALIICAYFISRDFANQSVASGILIGAIGGVLGHWRATWRARVSMVPCHPSKVSEWFESKGYVNSYDGKYLYPGIHRLLRFNSQNIVFSEKEGCLLIDGPFYILKSFINTRAGHS